MIAVAIVSGEEIDVPPVQRVAHMIARRDVDGRERTYGGRMPVVAPACHVSPTNLRARRDQAHV